MGDLVLLVVYISTLEDVILEFTTSHRAIPSYKHCLDNGTTNAKPIRMPAL
jgi:hypothetical protein